MNLCNLQQFNRLNTDSDLISLTGRGVADPLRATRYPSSETRGGKVETRRVPDRTLQSGDWNANQAICNSPHPRSVCRRPGYERSGYDRARLSSLLAHDEPLAYVPRRLQSFVL